MYAFYQSNEKLVDPFILSSQDKLRKSIKIIKFVDELKNTETVDRSVVQRHVEEGVNQFNNHLDKLFPHSYLSYNKNFVDHLLVAEQHTDKAKEILREQKTNMPAALQDDTPLRPQALRGPESDFYELTELENQNITSVLVENLFTEIAVLMLILGDKVKKAKDTKDQVKNFRQRDALEDLDDVYKLTVYNLLELIDVKDLLLGQYISRKKKFDEETAKQGYVAYINKLRNIYKDELDTVMQAGISPSKEAEVLQRLEQTNGDINKVIKEFL